MVRIHVRLAVGLIAAFIILNIAADVLASVQPTNPAVRGFIEECEGEKQPCWYGIMPGKTTLADARQILTQLGYQLSELEDPSPISYWQTDQPDALACRVDLTVWVNTTRPGEAVEVVHNLDLRECKHLKLGDLVLALGLPSIAYNCWDYTEQVTFGGVLWLNTYPFTASPQMTVRPLKPEDAVNSIAFDQRNPPRSNWELDEGWYGFVLPWKLNQLIFDQHCQGFA